MSACRALCCERPSCRAFAYVGKIPVDDRAVDVERRVRSAINRECCWLSGEGDEPDWPAFPMASPDRAVGLRIPPIAVELTEEISRPASRPQTEGIVDDRSAALWLKSSSSLFDVEARPWLRDLARSYAEWTAVANGRNLKPRDRVKRKPSEWNVAYYDLVARCLPGLPAESIDRLALDQIRSLPDESFFDATGYFLRSVDQVFFGNGRLKEAEAVRIRASLAERLSESPDWRSRNCDPSASIEVHMGSAIAAFFFNTWDRLPLSSCYLLPPDIARIEPFLPVLQRLVVEGPSGFVAGLVLDLVEVSPKLEHLSFIAAATETWLDEASRQCSVLGGKRICPAPLCRHREYRNSGAILLLGSFAAGPVSQQRLRSRWAGSSSGWTTRTGSHRF